MPLTLGKLTELVGHKVGDSLEGRRRERREGGGEGRRRERREGGGEGRREEEGRWVRKQGGSEERDDREERGKEEGEREQGGHEGGEEKEEGRGRTLHTGVVALRCLVSMTVLMHIHILYLCNGRFFKRWHP